MPRRRACGQLKDEVRAVRAYERLDKIAVRDRAKEQLRIKAALSIAGQVGFPEWVEVDGENMQGLLKNLPEREGYVMSMYYEHDMNLKEIAAVLGVTGEKKRKAHLTNSDVLDAVAGIAWAVHLPGMGVAIEGAAHAAVTDGVDADLHALLVNALGQGVELFRREKRRAGVAGRAGHRIADDEIVAGDLREAAEIIAVAEAVALLLGADGRARGEGRAATRRGDRHPVARHLHAEPRRGGATEMPAAKRGVGADGGKGKRAERRKRRGERRGPVVVRRDLRCASLRPARRVPSRSS